MVTERSCQRFLQQRKEDLRWRLLKMAQHAGSGLNDGMALEILSQVWLDVNLDEVRIALFYLELKGLVTLRRGAVEWRYGLTAAGIDCVDGNMACPVGIRRP